MKEEKFDPWKAAPVRQVYKGRFKRERELEREAEAIAAIALMDRPYTTGRPYAGLQNYNTNDNRLYKALVYLTQPAANTARQQEINLPCVVNPDGTALIPELCKVIAYMPPWSYNTTGETRRFHLAIDGPGTDMEAVYPDTDASILFEMQSHHFVLSVESFDNHDTARTLQYDLTDGAGNGLQIAQKPSVYFNTSGYDAIEHLTLEILYKQRIVTTAAYIAQRQHQRGGNQ